MSKKQLKLKRAVAGWLRWCESLGYSPNTINDYQRSAGYFTEYTGPDTPINTITPAHVERWMHHMQHLPPSQCHGATGAHQPKHKKQRRAAKTMQNYHTALSSLWTWATEHSYAENHIMRSVARPKVNHKPVEPLTTDQVIMMVRACEQTRAWKNRPLITSARPTAERDKAIIGLMIETGLRAQELCDLNIGDIQWMRGGGKITIIEGKGRKTRIVPFRSRCANYLNEYLLTRDEDFEDTDPLFITMERNFGLRMTRDNIYKLIKRIGKRAGFKTYPHQLRTTAACLMAANGMSAFELQRVMGHENIQTSLKYVRAAKLDLANAMRKASPMDNLRL